SIDSVQILTNVHLLNLKTNQEIQYTIVPDSEANLREKKISVSSPIAQGLFGKKEGEVVDINVPAGIMSYRIKKIEHAK
ncbi:MAG: GreA/GreB family elongation factor, partial [Bacteroidales bacterium]